MRGIIHLKLTNHVTIPVGRACQRLHFLHAASQATLNREKAGSYEVTYASGLKAARGPTQSERRAPVHLGPFP